MAKFINERLKLVEVDGVVVEEAFAPIMEKNLKDIATFRVRKDDVFVVTYVKCGTTWMQYIVWGILNKGATPPDINEMMFSSVFPFIEVTGTQMADEMTVCPRPLKMHLPFERVPRSPHAKYICVLRNPFDCCVSFYNFVMNTDPNIPRDVTLDEFFEYFLQGKVLFGDYFDHALGWYEHRNDPNVLFLSFESMCKDHRGTILKVAEFMGEGFLRELERDEEMLQKILHHSSFSFMKSLGEMRIPKDFDDYKFIGVKDFFKDDSRFYDAVFFRQGKAGDFKERLNDDQKSLLRRRMDEKFWGTELMDLWTDLL